MANIHLLEAPWKRPGTGCTRGRDPMRSSPWMSGIQHAKGAMMVREPLQLPDSSIWLQHTEEKNHLI